jgi:hypothetical protein
MRRCSILWLKRSRGRRIFRSIATRTRSTRVVISRVTVGEHDMRRDIRALVGGGVPEWRGNKRGRGPIQSWGFPAVPRRGH